ncbi:hypothetical protein [Blastococcus brunescens]|uniref:Uncharacterized protein n=1 Tax=Blastococcus brunescens TaxID=1564165 RepID=A0ABZ1B501_9ACTN|nr:hypothetical protein [Blastococcus sp. BMG 8361]WRL65885.1 hypothetical protein U6N30_10200 [Blastococcus sp. BMG 8361]
MAMIDSQWITWELCPRCGDRAAVGWREVGRFVGPVEFDCRNGCRVNICEVVRTCPSERAARIEHRHVDDARDASEVACDAVRRGAVAITIAAGFGGAARVTIVWRPEHS